MACKWLMNRPFDFCVILDLKCANTVKWYRLDWGV